MERRNIVVVGASAGGFDAIQRFIGGFSSNLEVTILIVWHLSPEVVGVLPRVLTKEYGHFASNAIDGDPIEPGRIYVAPADYHMLVERGRLRVTKGPKENRFRPAIDPLFRSAAITYGPRVIGVILTGALDDGASGLWAVKSFGGVAIVQDPAEAEVRSMPESALTATPVDYNVKVGEMGPIIERLSKKLVGGPVAPDPDTVSRLSKEVEIAMGKIAANYELLPEGKISRLTCPDCHGVLTNFVEGDQLRFRCHTGHAFSGNNLLKNIDREIDEYLWSAVRACNEAIMLLNTLGDQYAEHNNPKLAAVYFNKVRDMERRLASILAAVHFAEAMPPDIAIANAKTQK